MSTDTINAAFLNAVRNPQGCVQEMTLADWQWVAENMPVVNENWIASACYDKRAYLMDRINETYLTTRDHHQDAAEIKACIVKFLGYTPEHRELQRWH